MICLDAIVQNGYDHPFAGVPLLPCGCDVHVETVLGATVLCVAEAATTKRSKSFGEKERERERLADARLKNGIENICSRYRKENGEKLVSFWCIRWNNICMGL